MERMEKLKKLNWFHLFVLKAIVSEQTKSLTTTQIAVALKKYFCLYGIPFKKDSSRVFFTQKIGLLLDLGIITRTKGASNIYSVNPKYSSEIMLFTTGFFGFFEKK